MWLHILAIPDITPTVATCHVSVKMVDCGIAANLPARYTVSIHASVVYVDVLLLFLLIHFNENDNTKNSCLAEDKINPGKVDF